ncbi:ATP-binding protein [Parafrankia sp. EUN1f]|uniref:ATP-binding protein n=1 Tax=Parafrankia sp. EUN1f TaxID=102897 RepID=UPI0001C4465E|nr:ATP-binding protein [Parafrankia sp. EUN1f]EFC85389.1 putative anti-sigma regulatory factor, serine/threonine protein kinase [Parafrankia sp. EUN1f]
MITLTLVVMRGGTSVTSVAAVGWPAAGAVLGVEREALRLPSLLASVAVAERWACRLAAESRLAADDCEWLALALAVREAVANAMIHGNRLDPALPVRLLLDRAAYQITVTVSDQGRGFTPRVASDREVNLTPSGRGLVLIARGVDAMEVVRRTDPPRCDVVLVKHLPVNLSPKIK